MIRLYEGWWCWVFVILGCGGMWLGLFVDIEVDFLMYVLLISSVFFKIYVYLLYVD